MSTTRFGVGRTLSQSFAVLFRLFPLFLIVLVVTGVPEMYAGHWITERLGEPVLQLHGSGTISLICGSLATGIFDGLTYGVLTFATVRILSGDPARIQACIRRGVAVWPQLAVVMGLQELCWQVSSETHHIVTQVVDLTANMLILIALWLYSATVAVEGRGLGDGIRRSLSLVSGNGLRILAILLIVVGMVVIPAVVIDEIAPDGFAIFSPAPDGIITIANVLDRILTAFFAILAAVSFHQIRTEKEGAPVEDLALVFD